MNLSRVLFIGLGGAGQRHLRILHNLLPAGTEYAAFRRTSKTPLLKADFSVDETQSVGDAYGLKIFTDLESAFRYKPGLTVISTPTSCHREPLMMALAAGSGILVEKPWAENLHDFKSFYSGMIAKELPFLISFQRRFHPLISKAHDLLHTGAIGRPIAASFTVFSNVKTWHNYEDWRTLYAVRKDLGGGVLLTEIHELDLAYWFFGLPTAVYCSGGNRSSEKLDVEDTVQMILLYDNFSVQVTLCFMHPIKMRRLFVAGTDGSLTWNEEDNRLVVSRVNGDSREFKLDSFTNDTMFIAQARRFITGWEKEDSTASLLSAGASLAIVAAARASMQGGQVTPVLNPVG